MSETEENIIFVPLFEIMRYALIQEGSSRAERGMATVMQRGEGENQVRQRGQMR